MMNCPESGWYEPNFLHSSLYGAVTKTVLVTPQCFGYC